MGQSNWFEGRGSQFYRLSAVIGLAVALIGFFPTYTRPVLTGDYTGPGWGHMHGALALAWLILMMVQTQLAPQRIKLHRKLGVTAVLIIPAWFATSVLISREFALMTVARGEPALAEINILGGIVSPFIVLLLVGGALAMRKTPHWHKRLMFMATVLMLWPAWARWRHYFPDGDGLLNFFAFYVALSPILIAAIRDLIKFRRVHPAYLFVGPAIVAEQVWEIMTLGSPACVSICRPVFELLT